MVKQLTSVEEYMDFVNEINRDPNFSEPMLAKAIELNRPKGMMLLVDADDTGAIALYESMGFDKVEGQNNITAYVLL